MAKRMLIDAAHPEETRVVVLNGNRLEEFDFETSTKKQIKGNIYLAKVTRVEPSLQAAFVEYGGNRHGFLAFNEIHPDYYRIPVGDRPAFEPQHHPDAPSERYPRQSGEDHTYEEGHSNEENYSDEAGHSDETETAEASTPTAMPAEQGGHDTIYESGYESAESAETAAPENPENGESQSTASTFEPVTDERSERDTALDESQGIHPESDAVSEPETAHRAFEEDSADRGDAHSHNTEHDDAGHDDAGHRDADHHAEHRDRQDAESEAGSQTEGALQHEPGEIVARQREPDSADGEQPEGAETIETLGGDELEDAPRQRFRPHRHYKIQEVIKRRQIMLVQVTKEERGNKGAALTTYLSLAGRYCVLMPNTPRGGGVSRKITSTTDRRRLKELMSDLEVPDGMGVIVRTAGSERSKPEIKRDFEYLTRLWEEIRDLTLKSTAPALIYEEGNLIKRSIRDLYSRDIDEVVIDGDEGYRTAKDFMKMLMPSHAKRVKPYRDPGVPLFHRNQVESQIDAIHSPIVQLRSGGYIVINPTEALVAIDVNSGRATRERNIEETAYKTNLEAAEEVARQLRLRDLAGLIVIDFIDMEEGRNVISVERRLKDAMRNDRARIQIGRISPFGLMELSRQRLRPSLLETSTEICPHCGGTGHIRSIESTALHVLRAIEEEGTRRRAAEISVTVPTNVGLYILNQKRDTLVSAEHRYGFRVQIGRDDTLIPPAFRLDRMRSFTSEELAALPMPVALAPFPEDDEDDFVAEDEDETETVEVAAEIETVAAPSGEQDRGEDQGQGQRRRRRRRRRGGDDRPQQDGAPSEQVSDQVYDEGEPAEPVAAAPVSTEIEIVGETAEGGDTAEGDDEEGQASAAELNDPNGERKRRRRGRRGGRRRRRGDGPLEGESSNGETAEHGEESDAVRAEASEASPQSFAEEVAAHPEPATESFELAADLGQAVEEARADSLANDRRQAEPVEPPTAEPVAPPQAAVAEQPASIPAEAAIEPEPAPPAPTPEPVPEPAAAEAGHSAAAPEETIAPEAAYNVPPPQEVKGPPANPKRGWWRR